MKPSTPQPDGAPAVAPVAYRVPFAVDRGSAPWYSIRHIGDAPVRGVTLTELDAAGAAVAVSRPRRLDPGERLPFTLRARRPQESTVLLVRWLRADGAEYLWRVSF